MSNHITIGLDIDGVVANFVRFFTETAHELYPELSVLEDGEVSEWEFTNWYCTKKQEDKIWRYIIEEKSWDSMKSLLSDETWSKIGKNTIEMYFITSRPSLGNVSAQKQTIIWLHQFLFIMPQVICSNKKYEVCDLLNLDFYIDDKPGNIAPFYEGKELSTVAYLLYKPYMKKNMVDIKIYNYNGVHMPVVYSVEEFLEGICGIDYYLY